MTRVQPNALVLLAFGIVALIGLIVLEGTGSLADPTVRDTLQTIAVASLTAAAGISIPGHAHTEDAGPANAVGPAPPNTTGAGHVALPASVPPGQGA